MTANGVRYFLDLTDMPKPVLAGLIERSRAMKTAHTRRPPAELSPRVTK